MVMEGQERSWKVIVAEKLLFVYERSAPALSKTLPTFMISTILKGDIYSWICDAATHRFSLAKQNSQITGN